LRLGGRNDKQRIMDKVTQKNLLDLVKRNYEEIAADFDTTRQKKLWTELLRLAAPVKDGDRILDVGCGNGRLVEAFGEKKIEYVGVDNSEKLIEAAKKNALREIASLTLAMTDKGLPRRPDYGAPRNDSKFLLADILELDKIADKDFDFVYCVAVLHHLPGDEPRLKALEQMKNKIKPDGKIILTVWNLWSRKKFCKLIFKYGWLKLIGRNKMDCGDILFDWRNSQGDKISQRYYHAFSRNELKKLAVCAGLKIEKLYKDKYNYYMILTKSGVK